MVTRLVALTPSPACESVAAGSGWAARRLFVANSTAIGKKNNAADRPSPVDHRPQRLMQRVFEGSAHANTQLQVALRSKGIIGGQIPISLAAALMVSAALLGMRSR